MQPPTRRTLLIRAGAGLVSAVAVLCPVASAAPVPSPQATPAAPPVTLFAPKHNPGPDAFDAKLFVIRADPALDFWSRTPSGSVPNVGMIERIFPNDLFMPLVVMQHLGDTGGGKGYVTLDLSVLGADGKTETLAGDIVAWEGPLPAADVVAMSQAVFSIALDGEEDLGPVKILVDVHDHGSDRTLHLSADLELAPWTYGEHPASKQEFDTWFPTYYLAPHPAEAVRAYLEFADLQDANSKLVVLKFFATVFGSSPWLIPHLVERFPAANPEQRLKIAALLRATDHEDLVKSLPFADAKESRAVQEQAAALELPDAYGPLTQPGQLDQLWAEFLATGRYRPVRQIVEALKLAPFEKALSKEKPPKTDKERAAAMKSVLFQAARWSLGSNMEQHALVRNYVLFMLENETLDKSETAVLKALVAKQAAGGKPPAAR